MDDGKVTGVIFLDLKKAFDTVNHELLIRKLKNLGVSGKSLAWFNSYLIGRTQQTVCGDAVSWCLLEYHKEASLVHYSF